ncbi:hypothetical protein HLI03_19065 [Rhizobium laguerreae]|uniref:DNA cytosine methyltransferase n=1 Tax=Rhizobium laguerreae TaxID=1076926 RepID=UPI0014785A50|nr:DNA cytosine methyltransferase [Rhizobium laguerreae]NNH43732.1 hypothetical protein [Rhizobium laguerreae]
MTNSAQEQNEKLIRKLNAIELCAGLGGQALGLHSARFKLLAVCDSDKNSTATLEGNCPRWVPWTLDIRKKKPQLLERIDQILAKTNSDGSARELDLLSASLPWRPWDKKGKGDNDPDDLLGTFKELIDRFQPKAFMFETAEHFIGPTHREFYLQTVDQFAKADYRTFVVQPYFPDFGIPHKNDKIFIVGLKKEFAGDFRLPVLSRPNSQSFLELTAPIAFRERSAWSLGDMTKRGRTKVQREYDKWCEQWFAAHGEYWNKPLPPLNRGLDKGLTARSAASTVGQNQSVAASLPVVPPANILQPLAWLRPVKRAGLSKNIVQPHGSAKRRRGRPPKNHARDNDYLRIDPPISNLWLKFGFDVTKRREFMPRPGDKLPSKLPMTPDLLKQLQGFPSYWKLAGELPDQFKALHDATPPVIALALGRSIHAAISKKSVDLDSPGALTPELKLFFFGNLYSSHVLETHDDPALSLAKAWHDGVLAMRGELEVTWHRDCEDDFDDIADEGDDYEPDQLEWEDYRSLNHLPYDE